VVRRASSIDQKKEFGVLHLRHKTEDREINPSTGAMKSNTWLTFFTDLSPDCAQLLHRSTRSIEGYS